MRLTYPSVWVVPHSLPRLVIPHAARFPNPEDLIYFLSLVVRTLALHAVLATVGTFPTKSSLCKHDCGRALSIPSTILRGVFTEGP